MHILQPKRIQCKMCGEQISFYGRGFYDTEGVPHKCVPKVKIYTEEEKRALEESMRKHPSGKQSS